MTQRIWVSQAGAYLGTFAGGDPKAPPEAPSMPAGAFTVAVAPEHVSQIWDGAQWQGAVPAPPVRDIVKLVDALAAEGAITAAKATAIKGRL